MGGSLAVGHEGGGILAVGFAGQGSQDPVGPSEFNCVSARCNCVFPRRVCWWLGGCPRAYFTGCIDVCVCVRVSMYGCLLCRLRCVPSTLRVFWFWTIGFSVDVCF